MKLIAVDKYISVLTIRSKTTMCPEKKKNKSKDPFIQSRCQVILHFNAETHVTEKEKKKTFQP
jgi:hypothetical protein